MIARSTDDLQREAASWTRDELLARWEGIKARVPLDGWPDGRAFEYLVIRAFDLEGLIIRWPYVVQYPQRFGTVEQVDGAVYLGERAFLVESKNVQEPLAIDAVAKLRFRLEARPPGTMGLVFSAHEFTTPTEVFTQFATPLNILLWNRYDLDRALVEGTMVEALRRKLEHATEQGMAHFRYGKS
jgi:hypothetical protein